MHADVSTLQTGFSVEEKSEWIYFKGKLSNLHLDTHPGAEIVINNRQVIPSLKTLSQTPMPCSREQLQSKIPAKSKLSASHTAIHALIRKVY